MSNLRVSIDANALRHNLGVLMSSVGHRQAMAIVSADAFGHGMGMVASVLSGRVQAFGVHGLAEAAALRAEQMDTPIVLLRGPSCPEVLYEAANLELGIVLDRMEQVDWLVSAWLPVRLTVWLVLSVGGGMPGLPEPAFRLALKRLQQSGRVSSVVCMARLSVVDEAEGSMIEQLLVQQLAEELSLPLSVASSGIISSNQEWVGDWLRIGRGLYGAAPLAGMQAVMSLETTLYDTLFVEAGESLAGAWHAPTKMKIGVLPVGGTDGLLLTPGCRVRVGATSAPILSVSAPGMTLVDLSGVPGVEAGEVVGLWGEGLTLAQQALQAKCHPLQLSAAIRYVPSARQLLNG